MTFIKIFIAFKWKNKWSTDILDACRDVKRKNAKFSFYFTTISCCLKDVGSNTIQLESGWLNQYLYLSLLYCCIL